MTETSEQPDEPVEDSARADAEAMNAETGDASDAAEEGAPAGFVLQLEVFEGPLDLLLHLLEERQLEITEVSLLAVTEQYLAHLRDQERVAATAGAAQRGNLDALAEFVAVGARLLLLKSRALLPRDPDEAAPEIEDEDDPAALVRALQEYRRFKQAAEYLRGLEAEHRTGYRRSAPPPELPLPPGLEGVTLSALADLFRQILARVPEERPVRAVARPRVRLADRMKRLVDLLDERGRASFLSLLGEAPDRISVIVEFLAVLELIKARYLAAEQSEAFGDIDLVRIAGAPDYQAVGRPELEG